jgi:hypothetical protein
VISGDVTQGSHIALTLGKGPLPLLGSSVSGCGEPWCDKQRIRVNSRNSRQSLALPPNLFRGAGYLIEPF